MHLCIDAYTYYYSYTTTLKLSAYVDDVSIYVMNHSLTLEKCLYEKSSNASINILKSNGLWFIHGKIKNKSLGNELLFELKNMEILSKKWKFVSKVSSYRGRTLIVNQLCMLKLLHKLARHLLGLSITKNVQ